MIVRFQNYHHWVTVNHELAVGLMRRCCDSFNSKFIDSEVLAESPDRDEWDCLEVGIGGVS